MMVHFLNEFSSQPTPGQSGSKSDTESDIEFNNDVLVNDGSSDSDHDSVISKHRLDVRKSERAPLVDIIDTLLGVGDKNKTVC